MHIVLLGDFKQLPPATSRPPFVVLPSVHKRFRFAVLRENRRVVQADGARAEELEDFHRVLTDIAHGKATAGVVDFLVKSYGRGALASARRAELEGSTSVFTKRRYRDCWNRPIVRRLAKEHMHSLKIKARCRATYAKDPQWYGDRRATAIQRRARAQALWNLHLAGDWLKDTLPLGAQKHLMRVMLVSNVDVPRFANGTQGRLLYWHPGFVEKGKALLASHPELLARFVRESAYNEERELIQEVHYMDIPARPQVLKGEAGTSMVQVPLQPAYGLTAHKVQSLTIKHIVRGCLEGIFAQGTIYVVTSRVNDPRNYQLIGLPPKDLLDAVAQEWHRLGLDINDCLKAACVITGEWVYTAVPNGRHWTAAVNVYSRLAKRQINTRRVPVKLRTLQEALDPQPLMSQVLARLLAWIDREDGALQGGQPPPRFETAEGETIFPPDDEEWWLTDVQKQASTEATANAADEDGPASSDGEVGVAPDAAVSDDDIDDDINESDTEDEGADAEDAVRHARVDDFNFEAASMPSAQEPRQAPLSLWRAHGSSGEPHAEPEPAAPPPSRERIALQRDAVVDMPAGLRLRAKRGDVDIELV